MNPSDIKVTRMTSVKKHYERTFVTLAEVHAEIRDNPNNLAFDYARQQKAEGNRHLYDKFRKSIPAYKFSGQFQPIAKEKDVHNGLICLDFDRCDTEVRKHIEKDPCVALCFVSTSGKGLKVVVAIEGSYAHSDAIQWKAVFNHVASVFHDRYGIKADEQASHLEANCFSSHDPDAFVSSVVEPMSLGVQLNITQSHSITLYYTDKDVCKMPVSDAVELTYARSEGVRNKQMGYFARAIKFNCCIDQTDKVKIQECFRLWYNRSLPNISTKDYDENKQDFWAWHEHAKKPLLSPNNSFVMSWDKVLKGNYPSESQMYSNPNTQKAVALLWHIKDEQGNFFISCNKLATILGINPNTANRMLTMFRNEGIIEMTEKGVYNGKASRYKWLGNKEMHKV